MFSPRFVVTLKVQQALCLSAPSFHYNHVVPDGVMSIKVSNFFTLKCLKNRHF